MDQDEELRAHAEQCRLLAEQTCNSEDKARWLQMAERWLGMMSSGRPASGIARRDSH